MFTSTARGRTTKSSSTLHNYFIYSVFTTVSSNQAILKRRHSSWALQRRAIHDIIIVVVAVVLC